MVFRLLTLTGICDRTHEKGLLDVKIDFEIIALEVVNT